MIIHRHCYICGSALFFYIRCSLSRHENAQTFALSLCSSFLGNYRAAHSFSLRVAMARAIVFMGVFAFFIQISPFSEVDLHTFEDGIKHSNSRRALIRSVFYPGQTGTGQKCSNVGKQRPHLNICAPKPHKWVPLLYPVPYCPNAFLFRYNVKHERVCLKLNLRPFKDGIQYSNSSRALIRGVLDLQLSYSKTELRAAQPSVHRRLAAA